MHTKRRAFSRGSVAFLRYVLACFGLMLIGLEAKTFDLPEAPESMVWDRDQVFVRAPERKAALEKALLEFRDKYDFPIYLITINNSIAIDLRESMMRAREKWLTESDGILLCVDTSTYRLVTEEVTSSYHDENDSKNAQRLLTAMPAVIRPAYTSLALSARKQHINGIPLIEHYTLGVLQVVGQELDRPAVPEVSRRALWSVIGACTMTALLGFWLIERARRRSESRRAKESNYFIYRFPRVTRPWRLGGTSGGMICQRKFGNAPQGRGDS
jgi:hypothetical protein